MAQREGGEEAAGKEVRRLIMGQFHVGEKGLAVGNGVTVG
jgi:hypothetical protein